MKQSEMSSQLTWRKVKGHFKTITEHKLLVMEHCFRVGLYRRGLMHDLSKYMPCEFLMGCRYYSDGKSSPTRGERKELGYSAAWLHHKGRNRHHFEYWLDHSAQCTPGMFPLQPVQMPREYVAEMLMDRICASKNYNKEAYTHHDPLEYYERGKVKGTELLMHPQTAKELHGMLRILDERGEKELMRFVREYYLKGYPIS